MLTACKIPCSKCPFRKNSLPGWLADYTPEELHSIVMSEQPFPCHLTHEEELPWSAAGSEDHPVCAGSLLYMRKNAKKPRNVEMAALVDSVANGNSLDNILFQTEFLEHHKALPKTKEEQNHE